MSDLTNTNGVGSIDPKDTINIPENKPYPTKSASGLPEREGETAVIHGGDGIVQQQRLAHDVDYPSTTDVALADGTSRANQVQNARTDSTSRSGEFVDGGVASSDVPPVGAEETALRDRDYAPLGANETSFNGQGTNIPSAPVGEPYGVQNRAGGVDWFATEEQAQQYADSNPGFYRIRGEDVPERDKDLSEDERKDQSETIVWSKDNNGQLHQFANAKTRDVMLSSEPLLGYAYEPTTAEIDAHDGVQHTEESTSESLGGGRDTVRSLGPVSSDGKWYSHVDPDENKAFDTEADRDAYVDSTPGAVAYTLPAE